jgi:hypothetical protein
MEHFETLDYFRISFIDGLETVVHGSKQLLLVTTQKMSVGLSEQDCRAYKRFGISYLTPVIGLIWVSHTPPTLTVFDTFSPWQVSP